MKETDRLEIRFPSEPIRLVPISSRIVAMPGSMLTKNPSSCCRISMKQTLP